MNKNILFFIALAVFNIANTADLNTNKSSQEYTLKYTFKAIDTQNLTDFNNASKGLIELFESTRKNSSNNTNFYDKLLNFIKELQEAVIAGINLFSSASTTSNAAIETVNDIAQTAEVAVEALEQVEKIQTLPAQSRKINVPHIEIGLTVSCEDEEKENSFVSLKAKMDLFAQAFNDKTCSAEESVKNLTQIIEECKSLGLIANLTVNIVG